MSVRHQHETFESGPCQAASKKTAEHLAAQVLLERIAVRDAAVESVRVSDEDASGWQINNPKGKLLEWCAKRKSSVPEFQQQVSPTGYRVCVRLALARGDDLATVWYDAAKLKWAEQAAAADMLAQLPADPDPAGPLDAIGEPSPAAPIPTANGPNAAAVLNELRQAGVLRDVGYHVLDQTGPSHQPVFATVAWATATDGQSFRTDPTASPSKKIGQRQAADRLLDLLVAAGITRR